MKKIIISVLVCVFFIYETTFSQSYQWAVHGGGSSGDYGNSVAVDGQGNSFVTGWFQLTATFGSFTLTSAGGYDIFIVKYNSNGQAQWAQRFGGAATDIGYGIDLDANGNIYVAGTFAGAATFGSIMVTSNNGSPDIFVARFDTAGNPLWVQTAGSSTDDQAQAITVDKINAKIYVAGYFKSTATFGLIPVSSFGQSDIFIAKYDTIASVGSTPLWLHQGGGTSYEIPYSVCTDGAGNVYVAGNFNGTSNFDGITVTSAGMDDVVVAKYNSQGVIKWVHRDGGAQGDRGLSVTNNDNGIYYTGWFTGTAQFGTTTLTGTLDEIFISKLDTSGNFQWANKAGGAGYDQGYGICTDANSNVYITGAYDSVAQFGTVTLTSAGSWDVFIAKYSPAGSFQWVMSGGSPASNTFERDIGYSIKPDTMQNLYVGGIIRNTASFGPYSITSYGIQDAFVAKISLVTSMEENFYSNEINIFPNPSIGIINIKSGNIFIENVEMLNTAGQIVLSQTNSGSKGLLINVPGLEAGIYFLKIKSGEKFYYKKIVLVR